MAGSRGYEEKDSMMGGGMHGHMSAMMTGLEGKTGDDFDKAFIEQMTIHHEGAIRMAQAALTSAKHQEIKDLAQGIITAQAKEIQQMSEWNNSWYNR
jgi:uncharacterized protein (DUF305 family)